MQLNLETVISIGLVTLRNPQLLEQVDTKSKEQVEKSHTAQQVLKAAAAQGVDPKDALKKAKKMGAFNSFISLNFRAGSMALL